MSATRPRLTAEARRAAVLETACRVFSRSSYRGATTAEIARESGVTEPVLYRHFPSKRELYLAVVDEAWCIVRETWETVVREEEDPKQWVGSMGRAYFQLAAKAEKVRLVDLWIQALTEAAEDSVIRRHIREQLRQVHGHVVEVIRRSQAAGGIFPDRDPEAEAWIFISLGLLGTIDRRLGGLVEDQFDQIFASRRAWMIGA